MREFTATASEFASIGLELIVLTAIVAAIHINALFILIGLISWPFSKKSGPATEDADQELTGGNVKSGTGAKVFDREIESNDQNS